LTNTYTCKAEAYLITEFSDVDFIYNKSTGNTHILSPLPSLLLKLITEGISSKAEITKTSSTIAEVENDDHWHLKVDDALEKLRDINIIQCN
jgi:PqqD family protein of HPr-rel-A system